MKRPFSVLEYKNAKNTVQNVIARVCPAFGVNPPTTIWVFRTYLSRYRWSDGKLNIGWNSKTYVESVVLHELTHHIVYQGIGPHTHNLIFWDILWKVIEFYFEDHNLYSWQYEYRQGKTYARKRGLQIK